MVLVLDIGYILVLPITVEESVERPLAEALLVHNKATNIPTLALDINLHSASAAARRSAVSLICGHAQK